jgi:glycosyltransferase involved in cell wall biosynthesis
MGRKLPSDCSGGIEATRRRFADAVQVLFIHQNFPGQFRHVALAMLARGDQLVAIGGPTATAIPQVTLHRYDARPAAGVSACHHLASDFQTKCLRAEAVGSLLQQLIRQGLRPDLVVGHPGWGELLAVKDLLPQVPVLHQVEFVYRMEGGDFGFDPEFSSGEWIDQTRLRLRRATQLLAFHDLDWGLAPTEWQASTAPAEFRQRISVIHEGIDTRLIAPRAGSTVALQKAGLRFQPGDEVVSFVARSLEPYRGFHVFMRMLPLLQKLRPNAHVVIVGGDGVSYGREPEGGGSWRQAMLRELQDRLDLRRIHFVGRVPHPALHDLFRVTSCHVYLTYPFVLSWSLLEAMACGAVVIGSATPPVQEVIRDRHNGLLVDFFDGAAMAERIEDVLADPFSHRPLGKAARQTVLEGYDLSTVCLPKQLALIDRLAQGPHTVPVDGSGVAPLSA